MANKAKNRVIKHGKKHFSYCTVDKTINKCLKDNNKLNELSFKKHFKHCVFFVVKIPPVMLCR